VRQSDRILRWTRKTRQRDAGVLSCGREAAIDACQRDANAETGGPCSGVEKVSLRSGTFATGEATGNGSQT
jgi:hypothetical protein